jgi:hypothetical protein
VEACAPARARHRGVEAEELAVEGHLARLIPDGEIDLNTGSGALLVGVRERERT